MSKLSKSFTFSSLGFLPRLINPLRRGDTFVASVQLLIIFYSQSYEKISHHMADCSLRSNFEHRLERQFFCINLGMSHQVFLGWYLNSELNAALQPASFLRFPTRSTRNRHLQSLYNLKRRCTPHTSSAIIFPNSRVL